MIAITEHAGATSKTIQYTKSWTAIHLTYIYVHLNVHKILQSLFAELCAQIIPHIINSSVQKKKFP